LGMPFLDSNTCARGGGRYLFLPGFSSLYDAIHEWMMGRMDGKLHKKTTMMSFTICNIYKVPIMIVEMITWLQVPTEKHPESKTQHVGRYFKFQSLSKL
jgi:hypothetical protein